MQKYQDYNFPVKLKMLRLDIGKSQEEFSSELGISRSCLANYETGKRHPDRQTLEKIAQLFNVGPDYFSDQPLCLSAVCRERGLSNGRTDKAKYLKSLIQNRGNSLNISNLSVEHKISMIEYYDYILSRQKQEEKQL